MIEKRNTKRNNDSLVNKNKKAATYGLTIIFQELDVLKDQIDEGRYPSRYATIRSITILENFFRVIARYGIIKRNTIEEKTIHLYKNLAIDRMNVYFMMFKPMIDSNAINKFFDDHQHKSDDLKITLQLDDIDCDLKKYFNLPPFGIKATLVSESYMLQRTNDIKNIMKRYKIDPFCKPNDQKRYQEILDERNLLVHTLTSLNEDAKEVFIFTEKIIQQVLT